MPRASSKIFFAKQKTNFGEKKKKKKKKKKKREQQKIPPSKQKSCDQKGKLYLLRSHTPRPHSHIQTFLPFPSASWTIPFSFLLSLPLLPRKKKERERLYHLFFRRQLKKKIIISNKKYTQPFFKNTQTPFNLPSQRGAAVRKKGFEEKLNSQSPKTPKS